AKDSTLNVGGMFTKAGTTNANLIAAWSYSPVGINEKKEGESTIHLFPNPANDHITVNFDLPKQQIISFEITNVLGQVVYSGENHSLQGINSIVIDIVNLNKGIYFLQLKSDTVQTSLKFIKQ
nr:T9SS type A sorting domain-containing protein [Bacteroidota bacterium]